MLDVLVSPIPSQLCQKAVHFVAAHEQRTAFPLDLVQGADMDTYVYPGVHSNVGGGYGWNAQGRAPSDGLMLSQIALIHMHRLARSYGVPLSPYPHMAPDVKSDFELSPKLVKACNTYMECMDFEYVKTQLGPQVAVASEGKLHAMGLKTCSSFNALVRQHMRMRYAQLAKYLQNQRHIDDLPGVPSPQDREDLISCINSQLFSDYELCHLYFAAPGRMSSHYTPDEQQQFDHHKGRASLSIRAMAYWRSNTGGQEAYIDRGREMPWIQWAFEQLQANVKGRAGAVQGTAYFELMHQHTNDSLAGFYLLGFASNAEKAEKIEDVVAKQQAGKKLNKLERKIYANYKYRIEKMKDKKLFDIIDRRIQERPRMDAEEYAKKWAYSPADATYLTSLDAMGHSIVPTLTDADVPMLLEDADLATKAAVPEITSTRREGGGYLVQRGVFINGKRQQLAD